MKFNKEKYRDLHLRRNNLRHQGILGAICLENTSAEKDLEVLVDTKLYMSYQYALAVKKKVSRATLGKILPGGQEMLFFCSTQHW